MTPILFGIVLLVLAVLFAFLTSRAFRARRILVKLLGVIAALLTLILLGVGVVDLKGVYALSARHVNPVSNIKVSSDAAQIVRGQHLASLCASCHSTTGSPPLDGAKDNLLGAGNPIADLYPPNLTPGSDLRNWSDGELVRAIREGVDKEGRALISMPSEVFHNYADKDVEAVVAYLRSQPAVTHETPKRKMGILGTLLIGAGMFPTAVQSPITQTIVAPAAGPTADYGKYLVSVSGCEACHGADLTGGKKLRGGGPPPGPNLTQIVPRWSEPEFVTTLRIGTDPTGHQLDPKAMPWKELSAAYGDEEMRAIYAYLHGLTPKTSTP